MFYFIKNLFMMFICNISYLIFFKPIPCKFCVSDINLDSFKKDNQDLCMHSEENEEQSPMKNYL